ncbi:MAG: asparagine synthetase B family protein, partial [Candidatus Binatia bacterium]
MFASEVKALLASGLVVRRLNPTAVAAYLSLGSVPSPLTVIDGVRCLEPGSLLSFQDGRLRIRPYWDLVFQEKSGLGEAQVGEPLREHIRESVRLRLACDVPVGAFLSDEVDSSALLSFMRESVPGRLRTFSLAFEQPRFNKRPFARALAERFQTQHTEYVITSQEVLRELNLIVAAMDQPSVNGISSYFVSRVARSSGVAVALSGLGGDELFGGCPSFWLGLRLLQCDGSSGASWESRKAVEALVDLLPLNGQKKKIAAFLRRRPSLEGIYLVAKRLFWENSLERILSRNFINGSADFDPVLYLQDIGHGHAESPSNRISRLELKTDLHNQLLRDSDGMSMAHSLEVRAPFLDHGLVEFLAEVPAA